MPWPENKTDNPKKRIYSEAVHQRATVEWFRLQYPQYARLLTLGSFGENIGKRRMSDLKALGLTPGFPDLMLYVPRNTFHALGIEMKRTQPKGVVSTSQKQIHEIMRSQGYLVHVCYSSTEAINLLKEYINSATIF